MEGIGIWFYLIVECQLVVMLMGWNGGVVLSIGMYFFYLMNGSGFIRSIRM